MKSKKESRFAFPPAEINQSGMTSVIVDRETGVQYLLAICPNLGSGMTVLVDRDGKPLLAEP